MFIFPFKEDISSLQFFPSPASALWFVVQRMIYGLLFFFMSEHMISYCIEPLEALGFVCFMINFLSSLLILTSLIEDMLHCVLPSFPYSLKYILL